MKVLVRPAILAMIAACVALGGCQVQDKLVRDQFDRIQPHVSTQDDVQMLIGEPNHRLDDMWMYTRNDQHLTVMVDFDPNGRVDRKQWIDGTSGEWADTED